MFQVYQQSATQFENIFHLSLKSCIECEMVEFLPLIRNDESNSMFGRFQFAWWKLMGRGRAISALRNWNVKRLLQSGREQSSADGFVTVSNLKPHLPHWQQIRLQFDIFESLLYFFYFCILNLFVVLFFNFVFLQPQATPATLPTDPFHLHIPTFPITPSPENIICSILTSSCLCFRHGMACGPSGLWEFPGYTGECDQSRVNIHQSHQTKNLLARQLWFHKILRCTLHVQKRARCTYNTTPIIKH